MDQFSAVWSDMDQLSTVQTNSQQLMDQFLAVLANSHLFGLILSCLELTLFIDQFLPVWTNYGDSSYFSFGLVFSFSFQLYFDQFLVLVLSFIWTSSSSSSQLYMNQCLALVHQLCGLLLSSSSQLHSVYGLVLLLNYIWSSSSFSSQLYMDQFLVLVLSCL